jgi:hypothetical protein
VERGFPAGPGHAGLLYELGEIAAADGDIRELLFG